MADRPGKIEKCEKRFGVIAVEMGIITSDDLIMALKIQVLEDVDETRHRLLGEILMAEGKIMPEQISEVVNILFNNRRKNSDPASRIIDFPSSGPNGKT